MDPAHVERLRILGLAGPEHAGRNSADAERRRQEIYALNAVMKDYSDARADAFLLDGKAGPCQEYPDKFCRHVCDGGTP